jgi:hypothetical protein
MKPKCLKLDRVIGITATVTMIYLGSSMLDLPAWVSLALFVVAVVTNIWMVIRILKDPYTTDKTFDDYFYQDRPDIRRVGKEGKV